MPNRSHIFFKTNVFRTLSAKISAVIALLGLAIVIANRIDRHNHPVMAVDQPVQIKSGIFFEKEFEAVFSDPYDVELKVKVKCDLIEPCPISISKIDWVVTEGESVIAKGEAAKFKPSFWAGNYTGFRVASFNAQERRRYKIQLVAESEPGATEFPESHIQVGLSATFRKDIFVNSALIELFGKALVSGFLLFLGMLLFRKTKSYFGRVK
jgi:hypothetical protein